MMAGTDFDDAADLANDETFGDMATPVGSEWTPDAMDLRLLRPADLIRGPTLQEQRVTNTSQSEAPRSKPQGVCFAFLRGECRFGNRCKYRHEKPSEDPKRGVCNTFMLTGKCRFGNACKYRHECSTEERLRCLAYSGDTVKVMHALAQTDVNALDQDALVGVYTSLAIAYANSGDSKGAKALLDRVLTCTIAKLPERIFVELAKALSHAGKPDDIRAIIHHLLELDTPVPVLIRNLYVAACSSGRGPEPGEQAIEELEAAGYTPSVAAWTSIMKAHALAGDPISCRVVMERMLHKGIQLDKHCYDALVKAHGQMSDPEGAEQAIREMKLAGFEADLYTYSLAGDPAKARKMAAAVKHGVLPRHHNAMGTFNLLVNAHAQVGDTTGAEQVVEEMRREGLCPNAITFGSLLNAYAQAKDPDGARRAMSSMQSAGISPNMVIYNSLVKVYSLVGDKQGMMDAVAEMEAAGFERTSVTEGYIQSVNTDEQLVGDLGLDL